MNAQLTKEQIAADDIRKIVAQADKRQAEIERVAARQYTNHVRNARVVSRWRNCDGTIIAPVVAHPMGRSGGLNYFLKFLVQWHDGELAQEHPEHLDVVAEKSNVVQLETKAQIADRNRSYLDWVAADCAKYGCD
jgi:hypothetical protein